MRPETLLVLTMAVGVGGLVGVWPAMGGVSPAAVAVDQVQGCRVTDGDTMRCGRERIRLLGIDAPELPGHCREGRDCAPGDPFASTDSLRSAMASVMTIRRVGQDRYDRTLATVSGPKGDLSCWQLARHQAIYKPAWDDGFRVARACPRAVVAG